MPSSWYSAFLYFLITLSQILSAGIAITAFALLLYALTFNLRDRVARSFALILICIVIIFTTETIASTNSTSADQDFWLHLQWVGILFLPSTYLNFSDALLATTGKPSRWRRVWAIRISYLFSAALMVLIPTGLLVGPIQETTAAAPHLEPTLFTSLFILAYLVLMAMAWFNFIRALLRTTTLTSRRRMGYLVTSAVGPAVGSFPFLLYGSTFANDHALIFWFLTVVVNFVVGGLVVMMAYAVAFFGVALPDRVVKSRLFKWILRGPVTASIALGLTTLVRRFGETQGNPYSAMVPITLAGSILLCEYLITLFSPLWEKILFFGNDKTDLIQLKNLEDRLLTHNDLAQFIEMVLAAVCDRLQTPGAFVAAIDNNGVEMVMKTGHNKALEELESPDELFKMVYGNGKMPDLFHWGDDFLVPLFQREEGSEPLLLGLMGISGAGRESLDEDQMQSLKLLTERAELALRDRHIQTQVFQSLQNLSSDMEMIQRIRAAGRYDGAGILMLAPSIPGEGMTYWVKEALTHFWGGPKLTENPLNNLQIVQEGMDEHDDSQPNALRSVLKSAIERIRPEGDRRFTGEWILYNIMDLKFLEGRKVREVASKLAMSEADLYRKQRVAIEAVAKAIKEMEEEALKNKQNFK
ncbi:MAG: hypothetical protein AB9891_21805 [Anaerolineaceae bacterium]